MALDGFYHQVFVDPQQRRADSGGLKAIGEKLRELAGRFFASQVPGISFELNPHCMEVAKLNKMLETVEADIAVMTAHNSPEVRVKGRTMEHVLKSLYAKSKAAFFLSIVEISLFESDLWKQMPVEGFVRMMRARQLLKTKNAVDKTSPEVEIIQAFKAMEETCNVGLGDFEKMKKELLNIEAAWRRFYQHGDREMPTGAVFQFNTRQANVQAFTKSRVLSGMEPQLSKRATSERIRFLEN